MFPLTLAFAFAFAFAAALGLGDAVAVVFVLFELLVPVQAAPRAISPNSTRWCVIRRMFVPPVCWSLLIGPFPFLWGFTTTECVCAGSVLLPELPRFLRVSVAALRRTSAGVGP